MKCLPRYNAALLFRWTHEGRCQCSLPSGALFLFLWTYKTVGDVFFLLLSPIDLLRCSLPGTKNLLHPFLRSEYLICIHQSLSRRSELAKACPNVDSRRHDASIVVNSSGRGNIGCSHATVSGREVSCLRCRICISHLLHLEVHIDLLLSLERHRLFHTKHLSISIIS